MFPAARASSQGMVRKSVKRFSDKDHAPDKSCGDLTGNARCLPDFQPQMTLLRRAPEDCP
jgi:hypothetical protein